MGIQWLAVLGCLITHWRVDLWAGLACVTYLISVTTAAALNLVVARLNPPVAPLDPARLQGSGGRFAPGPAQNGHPIVHRQFAQQRIRIAMRP